LLADSNLEFFFFLKTAGMALAFIWGLKVQGKEFYTAAAAAAAAAAATTTNITILPHS
jgi:hypothetical protein